MNRQITIAIAIALFAALAVGVLLGRQLAGVSGEGVFGDVEAERTIAYWVAPMDPNYRRDEPGKSPMGMDLVPVYADEAASEPGTVSIDPTVVNNLGVRTEEVQRGKLSRRIETVANVSYDEDSLHHVHTRVEGWIEKLAAKSSGDAVEQGQLLFELYSPTLVNAQQEYLAALRSGNRALVDASTDRLSALGVTRSEIQRIERERSVSQRIRVFAETGGVIANLGVREGMYVTPAMEVMSIASLDRVWLIAEVFERQAAWVRSGLQATVEFDSLPGETMQGTVDYVYPELDPNTRTLKVRLRFDNDAGRLRPNMFARVTIFGDGADDVVHVPREALIRGGSVDRVVLALGAGQYRSQAVEAGIESGDRVAIVSGLAVGDRIVVSGQFLIDSESNIDKGLSRMNDAESGK